MAKQINLPTLTNKIYDLLKGVPVEDRQKVIKAAFTLLGDSISLKEQIVEFEKDSGLSGDFKKAKDFFENKDPKSKIEEIAVACRFRELSSNEHVHTKEQIAKVFDVARRNFDSSNFKRDLDNSKTKGLITKGSEIKLSYIGQKYVDALPDREEIKKLRKPRGKKSSKKKK